MPRLTRKCAQCGALDERQTWKSADEASRDRAFQSSWTCSSCAWPEFELVDADAEVHRAEQPAMH